MAPAIPKSLKDCCEAVLRILLRFNFKVSYSSQLKQRYDESAELSVIFKFSNNVAMHCALCRPALALFTLRFLRHFEDTVGGVSLDDSDDVASTKKYWACRPCTPKTWLIKFNSGSRIAFPFPRFQKAKPEVSTRFRPSVDAKISTSPGQFWVETKTAPGPPFQRLGRGLMAHAKMHFFMPLLAKNSSTSQHKAFDCCPGASTLRMHTENRGAFVAFSTTVKTSTSPLSRITGVASSLSISSEMYFSSPPQNVGENRTAVVPEFAECSKAQAHLNDIAALSSWQKTTVGATTSPPVAVPVTSDDIVPAQTLKDRGMQRSGRWMVFSIPK